MSEVKAVQDSRLSSRYESRWVIVDTETGRVLDDAQGYGYKSPQKAYAAYAYKTRSPAKKAQDAAAKKAVKAFAKEHPDFIEAMNEAAFYIAKGSLGSEEKFDAKYVGEMLKEAGFTDLPFTPAELLKYI